jgi:hypothetical protein
VSARPIAASLAAASVLAAAGARAQNVDIVEQNVALDIAGADTTLVLDATLEATGVASYLDLLAPGMTIDSFLVDGTPVVPAPHPQYPQLALRVAYPAALAKGQTVKLAVSMSGTPTCETPSAPGAIVCKRTPD